MKTIYLFFLLVLFQCIQASSAAASPAAELTELLSQTQSLSAHFTQNIYDESGSLMDSSSGDFKLAKPNLFRWEVQKPAVQLVISNNQTVWIYDPDLKQVIVKPASHTLSVTPLSILSGDSKVLAENFTIKKISRGYELTSETEDLNFKTIEIHFDKAKITGMVLFDNLGQKTELVFSNLTMNPSLKSQLFEFKPPKGVDVVVEK